MAGTLDVAGRRRRRRRRTRRVFPDRLHAFEFRSASGGGHPRFAPVPVPGKMDQVAAVDSAGEQARRLGRAPLCTGVHTVSPPWPTPALDALVRRCTAFPSFLALLTAAAGYHPSIRLDPTGGEGLLPARAYDDRRARWGDPRRAYVTGDPPRRRAGTPP